MSASLIRAHMHYIWSTWDREPVLAAEWEERVYAAITAQCQTMNCTLIAVNGMTDHLHVLLRITATVTLAQVAQQLKGATSHLINTQFRPAKPFRWQGSYAAFCVETDNVDRVRAYILS